jgi:HK97 gp10 family phage protein
MARDFNDFIKALEEMQRWMNKGAIERITEGCLKVEAKAKQYAPVDTGTLRRSIHTKIDERNLVGKVGSNLIYTSPLEFGAKIRPVRAKALFIPLDRKTRSQVARYGGVKQFISAVGGRVVYKKSSGKCKRIALVKVGSEIVGRFCVAKKAEIEPREFFKKAYEEVQREFPELIFRDWKRILKG